MLVLFTDCPENRIVSFGRYAIAISRGRNQIRRIQGNNQIMMMDSLLPVRGDESIGFLYQGK